jgi:hypothetical protein
MFKKLLLIFLFINCFENLVYSESKSENLLNEMNSQNEMNIKEAAHYLRKLMNKFLDGNKNLEINSFGMKEMLLIGTNPKEKSKLIMSEEKKPSFMFNRFG